MVTLTATFSDGTTDSLDVDAITSEAPQAAAQITEWPVEQGADVSDHIRPEARQFRFELVISNTPFGRDAGAGAEAAFELLVIWRDLGALITVPTTFGSYGSLGIVSVSATRDAKSGGASGQTGGLRISLALKEVRLVQNQLTTAKVKAKDQRALKKQKQGKQPTPKINQEPTSSAYDKFGATLKGDLAAYAKSFG